MRKLGATTLRSLGQAARLSRVQDDDRPFVPAQETLLALLADNRAHIGHLRQAHQVCDDHDDVASASLLEEFIDQAERRTWFLFETTRDGSGQG